MNRVAITGIGIISCLGNNVDTVGKALRKGKSGIVVDEKRKEMGFRSPLTGIIRDFSPQSHLSRKQRKTMPDFGIHSYAAVKEALEMSGLDEGDIQNPETGLIFGCDSSCVAAIEQVNLLKEFKETKSIGSGLVFRSMTSTITMNLNTILKTKGACWTISSACSSGGHAVGQAANLIALGQQDRIICGGAQEINWESMCSFDGLSAFSVNYENPEGASRPFDISRDGLVPSGGAAAVILENYDLAKKRNGKILGEIKGYGYSSDGYNLSVPDEDGLGRAMKQAIKISGYNPGEIDYVCAHATSTPAGDAAEAKNIMDVFGEKTPFVSSTKSMTGHELWMSGASQVVYSVIMGQQGFIAPNINFEKPDKSFEKLNVVENTQEIPPEKILCNSAGFGGTNSCLVIRVDI
ncbi:beta-ketoacyl-[acyl-carrier-protein] synthase family protein [Thermodesulfobacteriota bacterium]